LRCRPRRARAWRGRAWVGRPVSTVARGIVRKGGLCRAVAAERATRRRAFKPKPRCLATDRVLGREVERRLHLPHSPEQIANRLRLEHPDEPRWRVSHESIYQALYLQGRGGLKAELTGALRTGQARRRRKGPNPGRAPAPS